LEDFRNWNKTQDWMLNKQRDIYGNEDPDTIALNEKLAGIGTADMGMMGSSVGGLAAMLRASHGSPHLFNKFDFSKIGTGEGAQAYGHGGYFAQGFDSPVAKEYQDKLSTKVYVGGKRLDSIPSDGPLAQAHNSVVTAMSGQKIEPQEAINNAIKYWNNAADEMLSYVKDHPDLKDRIMREVDSRRAIAKEAEKFSPNDFYRDPGHLYNVELKWPDAAREAADPLGEHHLLDWDAPLSKQPKAVRSAFNELVNSPEGQKLAEEYWSHKPGLKLSDLPEWNDVSGEAIYKNALGSGSWERANELLQKHGIPGIRYLDQGSRGAGTGSRNYVMFDDRIPNIVSRNGVSLTDLLRR